MNAIRKPPVPLCCIGEADHFGSSAFCCSNNQGSLRYQVWSYKSMKLISYIYYQSLFSMQLFRLNTWYQIMIITHVSEVIMFSPCVFVCLWLCLCLYHDVCLEDLTMQDWCHTNNILQVHCWGCLVVQVMFHALMTSSMTSPGHKVGQILKVIYLRQYLS